MDNQKWEVVSYGKNKKGGGQKLSKAEKKKRAGTMPTIDPNDYLSNAKTGFALNAEETSSEASDGFSPVEIAMNKKTSSPLPTKQKKSAALKQKAPKPKSAKEILNSMDTDELRKTYTAVSKAFPDQPVICLTDLAAFIDRKFPIGTPGLERDWYTPNVNDDSKDFPLSELNPSAGNYLSSVIESISGVHLSNFIFSACQSLLLSVSRGTSSIGVRLMLQLVFKRSPRFLLSQTADLVKLTNESRTNTQHFFALFWCFTQAGRLSFEVGIRVLLEFLMPHINVKAYGLPIVSFAEEIITRPKHLRKNTDTIGYRDFFPLLDVMHASIHDEKSIPTNIAPNLMKRIQALYPSTKNLGFLCRESDELKTFFPSFLYRLRSKGGDKLTDELLACLTHCLINSPQCFAVWKQMHLKHLPQSHMLLCHVVKQWSWLQRRVSRSALRDLLKFFLKQHSADPPNSEGRRIADNAQILLGSSGPSAMERFLRILFFNLILLISLITIDVCVNESFKKSTTRSVLAKMHLAEPADRAWAYGASVADYSLSFMQRGACYSLKKIEPIAVVVYKEFLAFCAAGYELARPVLAQLWVKMEHLMLTLENNWPEIMDFISYYLRILGEYISQLLWMFIRAVRLYLEYMKSIDWTPVIAFSNQCWDTASVYMNWAYKSVTGLIKC